MKTNHQKTDRLTNRAAHDLETADAEIKGIKRRLTTVSLYIVYFYLFCVKLFEMVYVW